VLNDDVLLLTLHHYHLYYCFAAAGVVWLNRTQNCTHLSPVLVRVPPPCNNRLLIYLGVLVSFKICYETQRVVCHC
jgi:hypothetical protein